MEGVRKIRVKASWAREQVVEAAEQARLMGNYQPILSAEIRCLADLLQARKLPDQVPTLRHVDGTQVELLPEEQP